MRIILVYTVPRISPFDFNFFHDQPFPDLGWFFTHFTETRFKIGRRRNPTLCDLIPFSNGRCSYVCASASLAVKETHFHKT